MQTSDKKDANEGARGVCGFNKKFIVTVGAIAIGLSVIIGYAVWSYLG